MATTETPSAQRRALLIATGTYLDEGLAQLRAPAGDVGALADVLAEPAIGRFEVRQLIDRPTEEVRGEIDEFFHDNARNDVLLLYLSGHGVLSQDRELYFATSTTRLKRLLSTAIDSSFVNKLMRQSRARSIVLVLDCCHSGAFAHGQRPKSTTGVDVEHRFKGGRGRVTLTASTELEYAFEADDPRTDPSQLGESTASSIFTRYLVEGLKTGEADVNEDGVISVDELYDYVSTQVQEHAPGQTPGMGGDKRGEILIALSRRAKLPREYLHAIENPLQAVRQGVVADLELLLQTSTPALAAAVVEALQKLATDDSARVCAAAKEALARHGFSTETAPVEPEAGEAETSDPDQTLVLETTGERDADAEERTIARSPPPPPPPPPPAPPAWRRIVDKVGGGRLALIAALLVAAAVAAVLIIPGPAPPPDPPSGDALPYDFDDDGHQELVMTIPIGSDAREVLVHNGPGGDVTDTIDAQRADIGGSPGDMGIGLASADFDADGSADLAIGTPSRDLVTVLYSSGGENEHTEQVRGKDMQLPSSVGEYGFPLIAVDVDRDGFGDLVVGATGSDDAAGSGALQIVFGGRDGLDRSRSRTLTLPEVARFGERVRAGDVDGDRRVDLIEGAPDTDGSTGHAAWCRGTPDGPTACERLASGGGTGLAIADLDRDGADEMIVGDQDAGVLRIWRGTRQGPADPATVSEASIGEVGEPGDEFGAGVDAGDFDGDGKPELAVGAPGADRVFVVSRKSGDYIAERVLDAPPGSDGRFGNNLALLDLTDADGLDLVITAPRAQRPQHRLWVVRAGGEEPEDASGVADGGRGARARPMSLGRRAGARVSAPPQ